MNSPHHPHHEHHDVHQQRLLWFFTFCNQRSSSSSSSSGGSTTRRSSRRKTSRNKFAAQYQQQLQQQKRQSSNVFGCDLTEHTQLFSQDDSIPHIVKSCTRFIEKYGIIFGIYRLSGMRVNIHKLRQDFDKNPKISMIDSEAISNDAHAVACVLKQYFRELPIPLLTFHMYERFIELFKQSNIINSNSNNNNYDATNKRDSSITSTNSTLDNHDNNNEIKHDMEAISQTAATTTTNSASLTTNNKSKSSTQHPSSVTATNLVQHTSTKTSAEQPAAQFTSSALDSQLLSLSSVVTTTTSDIRYQVKLDDLKCLLQQLPKPHYQTLRFLMRHLACIAANGEKTGMDSKNVAIVWAPNLLKPRELELSAGLETLQVIGLQAVITEQLIKHHRFLFDNNDNQVVESVSSGAVVDGKHEGSDDHDLPNIDDDVEKQQQFEAAPRKTAQELRPLSSVSQVDMVMAIEDDKEQSAPKDVDNNQDNTKSNTKREEDDQDNSY